MPVKLKKTSKNIEETREIAKIFIEKILKTQTGGTGALVVGLSGDLGAGKTAFTQAVADYFAIKEKVNSPTFVIMKKYKIKSGKHKFLFHFDAYRLKNEKELLSIGWEEIINNKDHVVIIEWPENVKKIIPLNSPRVFIAHKENGHRYLELK